MPPAQRKVVSLAADAGLHAGASYHETGVEAGNGWQRQENGGVWETDWFGRAQAAVSCTLHGTYKLPNVQRAPAE